VKIIPNLSSKQL